MNSHLPKIIGIDFGKVRLGIAVSDESKTIAFGRTVFKNDSKLFENISKIAADENADTIVIGYPLNLKGNATVQTEATKDFIQALAKYFSEKNLSHINIVKHDERLTSRMASHSMLESGMKKKKRMDKSNIDIISAALILQSFLDSRKNK